MKFILAILALALLIGTASATNFEFVAQVPNDGPTNFVGTNTKSPDDSGTTWTPLQVGDTFSGMNDFGQSAQIPVGAKLDPAPTSSMNRDFFHHPPLNTLPRDPAPVVTTTSSSLLPAASQSVPVNAPKLSDIQGGIPEALQQAGVTFNGLKADRQRYRDAIATDGTGNPLMINDKVGLPYFMSTGAVPYQVPWASTKQSQFALAHGKAIYTNPDGSTTSVPLILVVDSQPAFHLWYKSTYTDPFIVLR